MPDRGAVLARNREHRESAMKRFLRQHAAGLLRHRDVVWAWLSLLVLLASWDLAARLP